MRNAGVLVRETDLCSCPVDLRCEGIPMEAVSEILQIHNVSRQFGGLTAVDQFNLTLRSGEIRALIGPNGAGKTSLFNLITGVLRCTAGRIQFKGQEIGHLQSYKR